MNRISGISCRYRLIVARQASASYKSKIAKKTSYSAQLPKLGLDDHSTLTPSKIGVGMLEAQSEKAIMKTYERKAEWDALSDQEKEAIYETQREMAKKAAEEDLKREESIQAVKVKVESVKNKAKHHSGKVTKGEFHKNS